MSCGCTTSPCSHSHTSCDSTNEPLSSALNNFITIFFGSVTKTCVNNVVTWSLPCDLEAGNPSFPRDSGESLACYFNRFITTFTSELEFVTGRKGYSTRALTNVDIVLFRNVDVVNQDFTGTLTGPVDIFLSSNGAINGDEFYISFDDLVITATNNIEIMSDATSVLLINTAGTLNGYLKAVYTGTAWDLTDTSVNIT